jgi:hypothetical protein
MFPHVPGFRRLARAVSLVAVVAIALACGGGGRSKGIGTVKVNEKLVFNNDSTWVVLEAKDLGKELKPTDPDDKPRKTEGRFIQVRYKITNTGKQVVWLDDSDPPLVDDRDRTFESMGDAQKQFLPKDAKTLSEQESDQIPAGLTREFYALYEVPADAKGLRLKAESFPEKRRRAQEGFIDLGL